MESLQPYLTKLKELMAYHVVTDNHLVTTIFDTESGEFISRANVIEPELTRKKRDLKLHLFWKMQFTFQCLI
jgi:hypothetical protein